MWFLASQTFLHSTLVYLLHSANAVSVFIVFLIFEVFTQCSNAAVILQNLTDVLNSMIFFRVCEATDQQT